MPAAAPFRLPSVLVRAGVGLRPETTDDRPLARTLYGAARADELAGVAWPPTVIAAFIDSQFAAQSAHYATNHPTADRWIVMRQALPIGRFYVDRSGGDWRLLDIVLAQEARGSGIGAALVTALFRAACREGAGVALSVARDNSRAEAFYRRLGFVEMPSDHATHKAMHAPVRR